MKSSIIKLAICLTFSVLIVVALYAVSHKRTHQDNGFHRLLPPHPVTFSKGIDLKYNSYYISGTDNDRVYLSNVTAPFHLLSVDLPELDTTHIRLRVEGEENMKFRKDAKIEVSPPYFYMTDGVTPRLLRGKIGEWYADRFMYDSAYFVDAVAIGPKSFAMRTTSSKTREQLLGKETDNDPHVKLVPGLLEKQIDGVFCTDGTLNYNRDLSQLVYLYFYRNEYIVMDTTLTLLYRGNTIDTTTRAKIKTSTISSNNSRTMAAPPLLVNKMSSTAGDYLFVHSNLMAKNESKNVFNEADVIDVYNLKNKTYEFSFYIYPYNDFRLTRFRVTNNHLIALHNQYLVIYDLQPNAFDKEKKTPLPDTNGITAIKNHEK